MEVMGVVGVMVNCALIGMSGPVHRLFPNISTAQTVLLIIVLEVRRAWGKTAKNDLDNSLAERFLQ